MKDFRKAFPDSGNGLKMTNGGIENFRTRQPDVSSGAPALLIIPARNEEASIGRVIQSAREAAHCPVLVIDDASSDKTASKARKAGARVFSLAIHSGPWTAAQTGLRHAEKNGLHPVVTMDGDGQHMACHIPRLVDALCQKNAEMAIGAFPERGSMGRRTAWGFFRTVTGLSLRDMTSGFRAYSQRAIALLSSREASLLDYQDIGVILLLEKNRLKICEVNAPMAPRASGRSKIFHSWPAVLKYVIYSVLLSLSRTRFFSGGSRVDV
jgi:glycosyltransferase involved in cell wall biosynthesis